MDFTITEDQATLTEGVRDYLAGVHAPELLRALDASDSRRSADVWQGLVQMGLPGLLVPEAQGGLGLSLLDAVQIAAELGRAGVAEPLADTALVAAPLLSKVGGQEALLAAIAAGEAKVAPSIPSIRGSPIWAVRAISCRSRTARCCSPRMTAMPR